MNSDRDINSKLGEVATALSELVSSLKSGTGASSSSSELDKARDAVRSLQSDAGMATNVSRSFNRPSTSGSSIRAILPSVSKKQAPSHRFSPYSREKGKRKSAREPRRYDMKLAVVDYIPELFGSGSARSITNYRGGAIVETAFFLMEDESAHAVHNKIMKIVKSQYPDYPGEFVYATRRNRNQLTVAADQDMDARAVRTLKGTGSVYIVLDTSVAPEDEGTLEEEEEGEQIGTFSQHPTSSSPVNEERARRFRQEELPALLSQKSGQRTRKASGERSAPAPTPKFFRGYSRLDERIEDSDLEGTGLMNPGGRKGSLIAALMVLQWILPFMTVVSSGVSQILTLLKKCYEVRGVSDFRVKIVLDSLLSALGLSTESADPNLILERTLQVVAEHEEAKVALATSFGGKRSVRTVLSSSLSEDIIFAEDNEESSSSMMINVKMPVSETHRLRDALNDTLKQGEAIPFSNWKEEWKSTYSSQEENDKCDMHAASYQAWKVGPDCLILGLNRNSKKAQWPITAFYTKSWNDIKRPSSPSSSARNATLSSVGEEDECVIIEDTVKHEAVLHRMEKEMNGFVGLAKLKEQFLRFTRTQLQNDRRKRLGRKINTESPIHLVFAGNPGTGKTTFARRVAELLYSIRKIRKNKVVEVQRSDLVGQYLGSTTEKTKAKILEARGGVLFVDEAYRLIPTAGKDFGREAIEELMAVMEEGDPVMIFAGYEKPMEKFLNVNQGLRSRIYRKFVFPDYTAEELGEIFNLKAKEKGFVIGELDVPGILSKYTTQDQRKTMNARLVRILLEESIEEASQRLPLDAPLQDLMKIEESDIVAGCLRLPSVPGRDDLSSS